MDALTEVGVNVDDPKNVLVPDLLRRFSEDVLRSTRNDLFESAKASGLVHPKDILVKRIKRAIGPSLAEKYAADIFELCYLFQSRNRLLLRRASAALLSPRMRRSHRTTPLRLPARAICLLLFPTGRLSPCARPLELPASQTTQS